MGKTLRVGFALGGGVSLGTFNGAALAESLKLLVLCGTAADGTRYDRVVVDVFSGASAGAMSLGIMLRTLVHRTPEQERAAEERLAAQFGEAFAELRREAAEDDRARDRLRDLVAAQVLQDVQERIWVEEIDLDGLLGDEGQDLRHGAGLLRRRRVEEIAESAFDFGGEIRVDGRRMLAERVLFAATLSNLTAMIADARADFPLGDDDDLPLADAITSRVHSEVRVFDLHFCELTPEDVERPDIYPRRWCRYHLGPHRAGSFGPLAGQRLWRKIAATTIASGAFPLAFEPVVLERDAWEYGPLWPKSFASAERETFPFTFADGGVFNNEPVREAFRMAAFLDAHDDPATFDRLIVFVDPFVDVPVLRTRLDLHQRWLLMKPGIRGTFDGLDLQRRGSLDRLLPAAGSLFSALFDEARVVEADRAFGTRARLRSRDAERGFLASMLTDSPTPGTLERTRDEIRVRLEQRRSEDAIPAGPLTLAAELTRVIHESPGHLPRAMVAGIPGFLADPEAVADRGAWLRALAFVRLDLAMGLEGKTPHARLVGIGPIVDAGTSEQRIEALPGGALQGFAGFMSKIPGRYEVRFARHVTRQFLQRAKVVDASGLPGSVAPILTPEERSTMQRDVDAGIDALAQRVGQAFLDSRILQEGGSLASLFRGQVARLLRDAVRSQLRSTAVRATYAFEVRVPPGLDLELDGDGTFSDIDLPPVAVDGQPTLMTFLEWDAVERRWHGPTPHLDDAGLHLLVHESRWWIRGGDREFCRLALPEAADVARADVCVCPVFRTAVTHDDDRRTLRPNWEVIETVVPLEDRLNLPRVS